MEGNIISVIKYWIEGEIEIFIKVWLLIYASLCYCYLVIKIIPKGLFRLLSFLPMICFFLYLPLKINSVHLCGNTAFFISWLCNFKLLLLAFDQGSLSDSSLSITKFLILACLPIKIQQKSQEKSELYVQDEVNRGRLHQNGHFRKTPLTKSAEKVSGVQIRKDFDKNGHFQETPSIKSAGKISSVQTRKDFDKNGHFQETPSIKSAGKISSVQTRKDFDKNGYFQETPSTTSAEKKFRVQTRKDFDKNGHFQETPSIKSAGKISSLQTRKNFDKNGYFQETPSTKSAEKISSVQIRKDFDKNGHFQETPSTKSAEKISSVQIRKDFDKNGHFQETPSTKSAEKISIVQTRKDFDKNGHFQETPAPLSAANTENNPFQDGHFHETPSQKSAEKSSSVQNGKYSHKNGHLQEKPFPSSGKCKSILNYGIKTLLFALILRVYDYSDYIHPHIIMVIYCFHIYFSLEIILAIVSGLARGLLGLELEPQFNEPYLSTSLQDFWGRRWNLIVTRILRPTVYNPTLSLSTNILGRKWAPLPAVMATFVVSGLMHELIFYYLGRVKPTWEITWFFLLHGVCLNIEICVKKAISDRFKLPTIIGTIWTVGFVMITGFWLFFPQLLRCNSDVRAFKEYEAIGAFFKDVTNAVNSAFLRHKRI
uniref:Wax synthase domain-containing protein n=1 Tax=Nicotiana tabacum TaxID=4097 RepID=A0A1S4CZ31_TOBAC|nr:PREDICTED: uncharacterized protein LOC107824170 [Nicotiana tabacum]